MRVVVLGYHDIGFAGLDVLLEAGHDVLAVYTHHDDPAEQIWFGSVADLAASRGIPVHRPQDINEGRWVETLRRQAPDAVFSFHYRRLVCPEITGLPPLGALNLHGSLLPRYRGRCPLNWVLVNGERETGVSLHHMSRRADAGDIVAQRRVAIEPEDTAPSLHRKIVGAARGLLRETLPSIERGTAPRIPQELAAGSYHGARRPEDGRIDWARPASEIHNLVRALTQPWPGAFAFLEGRKLFIWESAPERTAPVSAPGGVLPAPGVRIGTGDGALRVVRCQMEGESVLEGAALGRRLRPGTVLG